MKNNQTSAFKVGGLSLAIASILGASALPLSAVAQQSEDEVIEEGFDVTPSSIASIRDMARRLATSGYLVILPNLFYRISTNFLR